MASTSIQQSVRLLTDSDVRGLLCIERLVGLIESALASFSDGEVVNPQRTVLFAGNDGAYVGVMPAFLPAEEALGTKLVTAFAHNKGRGLPSHFATVILLDPATGALRAIVDGRYITEMRTAAVSAVACRHLAPGPIRRLAILGAGVQARGHLQVLDATLSIEEVVLWSPRGGFDRVLADVPKLRATAVLARTAEEAVRGAQAVVLVTDSQAPVIQSPWVEEGVLVVCVGACRPDHREMDPELLSRAWLIVDSRRSALAESGDVIQGIAEGSFGPDHIRGEIGDVIRGRVAPRRSAQDVVVFKSLGLAVEDVASASMILQLAEERRVGFEVTL